MVWSSWLAARYGRRIIQAAWERSVASGGFAPGAYDRAIRAYRGRGFASEFVRFAASTAFWRDGGIRYPDSSEYASVRRGVRSATANTKEYKGRLDHAAYLLLDVLSDREYDVSYRFEGSLPRGVPGGIALAADYGYGVRVRVKELPRGGRGSVTLRVPFGNTPLGPKFTGVIVNTSTRHRGWNGVDWRWTQNRARVWAKFWTPRCLSALTGLRRARRSHNARRIHQAELLASLRCGPSIF